MHAQHHPPLTVVALCYNHERYLRACLDSIARQTFQDFELIVCDDASTDGSAALIEAWIAEHRPSATFIRQAANIGICQTLNVALSRAQGRYLSMISTDDMWEADKLERQFRVMEQQPAAVGMAYSDASLMDGDGAAIPGRFIERYRPGRPIPSGDLFIELATNNFIPAMSTMIRTEVLREVGGYDESLAYEDWDMWLRIAERYRIVYVDGALARYRLHTASLTESLLKKANVRAAATHCAMAIKLLASTRLTPELRQRWVADALGWSREVYVHDGKDAATLLFRSGLVARRPRWLVLALASSMRLSHTRAQRVLRFVRRS